MPRMTTYMLGGTRSRDEIIASIKKGLYATNWRWWTSPAASLCSRPANFWVENGGIQYPVKGATLIGNGPEAMTRVSLIGNDMELDTGVGVSAAGRRGAFGVGQPTLRIDRLTVGGTA